MKHPPGAPRLRSRAVQRQPSKPRARARGIGRWVIGAAGIAFGVLAYTYLTLPDVRPLARTNPTTTAFMELRVREARRAGKAPRKVHHWVAYNRISPNLKRAVLTAEDAAFWDHDGVDYDELQKSIETDLAEGRFVRGASTITQQLAKNLYLSPSRNPVRKLRELIIARRLEAELSKSRILEIYMNVIVWGYGIYGVEAAARTYFGASASSLGPSESALLAGAIVNARLLNPARPTARLLRRQQLILRRMGGVAPPVETAPAQPETSPPVDPNQWPLQPPPPPADTPSSAIEGNDEKATSPELDRSKSGSL